MTRHVRVAIIGAGFSGLGMAAQLVRRGQRDFLLIERAVDVGGTWRDNTYPGAACDIRSDLYSFSFAPNPGWTRTYGQQSEILEYLRGIAARYDLGPQILFGSELERADWDSVAARWTIRTSTTRFTADVLVSGHGPLIDPVWPAIAGIDTFTGPRFHSARWDHGVDLAGKRVAVIGTGASAIQFVPELQKIAGELTLFQRSAPWIIARGDRPTSKFRRASFRRFPFLQRISREWIFRSAELRFSGFRYPAVGRVFRRVALGMLWRQLRDPDLRARLTPDYRIGCKRILVSSTFYPALAKDNVELVTTPIARIDRDTIVDADGTRRRFDILVAGTGFNATRPPVAKLIFGREGRSLDEVWSPNMSALRGTTVAGFPNLFLLIGPNTALGHNSLVYIIEAQIDHVLGALDLLQKSGSRTIEPAQPAQAAYNDLIQRDLGRSVWNTGGCTSFYLAADGTNSTIWPHRAASFRRAVRRVDAAEYLLGGP